MDKIKYGKNTVKISLREMLITALFTTLIAIGTFIKIPLPLCPVTLNILFVILSGLLLGKRNAALSVLIYILIGLVGFPVFTEGGGISYIFKPTFGYLIGYLAGAYSIGAVVSNNPLTFKRLIFAGLVGLAVIYLIGMVYFYIICNFVIGNPVAVKTVLISCFLLIIPKDIALCILSAFVAKRITPFLRKYM